MRLYPHQREAVDVALAEYAVGCQRQVVQMATGAGKTAFAAALTSELLTPDQRCLFLGHRDRLLTQARDAFLHFFPSTDLGIVQAKQNTPGARIVFGSFQTLANPNRLQQLLAYGRFRLVIVDEAHHSVAESYRQTIKATAEKFLLGLTATPSRSDRRSLRLVFDKLTYSVSMLDLITADPPMLCDLKCVMVQTQVDLSSVDDDENGDFNQLQLSTAIRKSPLRHPLTITAIRQYAHDWQGIYFGADVHDARMFAKYANEAGIVTECIFGNTPEDERKDIFARYEAGETQYLSNAMVLTEGVDLPMARVAVIGRPTKSQELFIQMVGRVTRVLDTDRGKPVEEWRKPFGLVLDLVDNQHTVLTLPDLVGSTEEVMKVKSVRQIATEERARDEDDEEHKNVYATPQLHLKVAPRALLTQGKWIARGQDMYLTSKYGTAVAEHDLGKQFHVLFEAKNGRITRLSKRSLPYQQAFALGEQHIERLAAADTHRTARREDPHVRSRIAPPDSQAKIKRLYRHLTKRNLTVGEVQDWWDKHHKAQAAGFKSYYQTPEWQTWSKGKPATGRQPKKKLKTDDLVTIVEE